MVKVTVGEYHVVEMVQHQTHFLGITDEYIRVSGIKKYADVSLFDKNGEPRFGQIIFIYQRIIVDQHTYLQLYDSSLLRNYLPA